jgi:hypothetical protein
MDWSAPPEVRPGGTVPESFLSEEAEAELQEALHGA